MKSRKSIVLMLLSFSLCLILWGCGSGSGGGSGGSGNNPTPAVPDLAIIDSPYFDLDPISEILSSGLVAEKLDGAIYGRLSAGSMQIGIVIDSNDHAHIGYGPNTRLLRLRYATNRNGKWEAKDIYEVPDFSGTLDVSIKVDNSNNPHTAFGFYCWDSIQTGWNDNWCGEETDLIYATDANGKWEAEILDDSSFRLNPSLIITPDDVIHIVYSNWNKQTLNYLSNDSGIWNDADVVSGNFESYRTSATIDGNGEFHITSDENYFKGRSGSWFSQAIDHRGSLGVDGNNDVHMISRYSLRVVHRTNYGSGFQFQAEINSMYWGYPSLAIDSGGNLHVILLSYTGGRVGKLVYLTNFGGAWENFVIDETEECDEYSIDIDLIGNVHIAYTRRDDLTLRYVSFHPSYFVQ